MKIISLDCATKKTGYTVWIDGQRVETGLILGTKTNKIDKLLEITSQIRNKIIQYDVGYLVLEEVEFHVSFNRKVARDLALLQGMVLSLVGEFDLGIILYSTSVWRSLVGYNGNSKREVQKQWAVDCVNDLYGMNYKYYKRDSVKKNEISDDDMAESILIGSAYLLEAGIIGR